MNTLHLPEDLWAEGKQGFGVLFSLSIKRIFPMHPECFCHLRLEKCLPQLSGIMFTSLCFPISFLSDFPPQKELSSLLTYWMPDLQTFFLPVHIFLSSSSFTHKLSLQLQLASCPTSLSPICHILHTVPSSFCCCGTKQCWKMFSALGGSGRFRRASEPWRNLQQQLLHACLWVQRNPAS